MSASKSRNNSRTKPGVRRIVYNDDADGMQLYTKLGQVKQDMEAMIDGQFATVPGIDTFACSELAIKLTDALYDVRSNTKCLIG